MKRRILGLVRRFLAHCEADGIARLNWNAHRGVVRRREAADRAKRERQMFQLAREVGPMKRILMLVCGLAMVASLWAMVAPLWAADKIIYTKVAATAVVTNTTLAVRTQTVLLINDGANEVYFDLYNDAETPADATVASKELKAGETLTLHFEGQESDTQGGRYYKTLSIICAAAETATVRVFSK